MKKTKSLKQGQEPQLALSLGTGVCSSNLCFSPWATLFPSWKLSLGANRREGEEGGQFILSATQVLEGLQRLLEGIWMLRTPWPPPYSSLMLIRRYKESLRTKFSRNPQGALPAEFQQPSASSWAATPEGVFQCQEGIPASSL